MKTKGWLITIGIGAIVLAGGGYGAYDYFAGNHIEVKDVISKETASVNSSHTALDAGKLAGNWIVQPDSKVYFSVTTSKETVNFEGGAVQGSWQIDLSNAAQMKAEGSVDMGGLNSGNPQRHGHIKGASFLNTANMPVSTFKVNAFEGIPKEWKEGSRFPFKMTGTLSLRGISKEVSFDAEAVPSQDSIQMEGSTVVTFDQFGMKNPHTVTLDTQNDVKLQLRLVLKK